VDYGERLAKVETEVDTIKEQLHEIKEEQVRLREHTDRGLADLRDHMDRGFAEMRAEQAKTTRWLIGLAVTYGTAIIAMMAKMSGMF
jgi:hypothetical protein